MSNNMVKDWAEFSKLVSIFNICFIGELEEHFNTLFSEQTEMPMLVDLLFVGNPLEEKHTAEGDWRKQVSAKMKNLKKLDGFKSYFCLFR